MIQIFSEPNCPVCLSEDCIYDFMLEYLSSFLVGHNHSDSNYFWTSDEAKKLEKLTSLYLIGTTFSHFQIFSLYL